MGALKILEKSKPILGLCNGTRMIFPKFGNEVIEARVISSSNNGEIVLIQHIKLSPTMSQIYLC